MKVETYEVTEVAHCTSEESETAKALAEQLGLEGQQRYYGGGDEPATSHPYRKMTKQESLVYGALLARKTELKKYADGPVPLRVLQLAAHANEVIDGATLYVWHPENADVKDPLLVAQIGPDWQCERYLLARWGEELDEWAVLLAKAKAIITAKTKAELLKLQSEIEQTIRNVDAVVEASLLKGRSISTGFYCH